MELFDHSHRSESQLGLCILLREQSWWLIVAVAFFVGAFASHALWVMIHECAHNLVFRKTWINTLAGMVANLPHVLPSSVSFQRYHLKHHTFQGVYDLDADLPSYWEAKLIGKSAWGKGLLADAVPDLSSDTAAALERNPHDRFVDSDEHGNPAFEQCRGVFHFRTQALMYLLISFFFSVGLHPLGARWIQEHYMVHPSQETYSYYGPLNTVAFNVGYHNEHHDLPSIPWNHLPAVRQAAPELYDTLIFHTSWTKLLWRFLFDPSLSLFSRQVRESRGGIALNAPFKPDIEFLDGVRPSATL